MARIGSEFSEDVDVAKYYGQRHRLWSRFDQGVWMTKRGWYEVTPESISRLNSEIHRPLKKEQHTVLDLFCGCGGDTVQLAQVYEKVIAVDIDADAIEAAKKNAFVYGVAERISFLCCDVFSLKCNELSVDAVHCSPPWGGQLYLGAPVYDFDAALNTNVGVNMDMFFRFLRGFSHNITMLLPRNVLASGIIPLGFSGDFEVRRHFVNDKCKAITVIWGDLVSTCTFRPHEPPVYFLKDKMRRLVRLGLVFSIARRDITLRPEATKDPIRYPLGYVPLDGTEPIDSVFSLVKSGFFVCPLSKIETIHRAYIGVRHLAQFEYPAVSVLDVLSLNLTLKELCSRLLIRRDFWSLEDFNDPELNSSFGVQNVYFDNFKWSQVLWKRFQVFVEEYFPITHHTHLTYSEYLELLRSFSRFEQGITLSPLLPRKVKLHPPFGVSFFSRMEMEALLLYKRWLINFRGPLMLQRALIVWSRCGATAFATRQCGLPMVRGVDPNPRAVGASCKDARLIGKQYDTVSFRVGEMFPKVEPKNANRKYDMIMFSPDQGFFDSLFSDGGSIYTPGMDGFAGCLEQFFSEAGEYLSDSGVLCICCTNLNSLLKPKEPHPIEYEIKVNRRWVLLDYYDVAMRKKGILQHRPTDPRYRLPNEMNKQLRSELWVLHKVESIAHFGFIHNIPGSQPPSTATAHWRNKSMSKMRQRIVKSQVEFMGGDWGDYKTRMMHLLQEQGGDDEDDVAQAVRMTLDPAYPLELAERARIAVNKNMISESAFHADVFNRFTDVSPRDLFDRHEVATRKY